MCPTLSHDVSSFLNWALAISDDDNYGGNRPSDIVILDQNIELKEEVKLYFLCFILPIIFLLFLVSML